MNTEDKRGHSDDPGRATVSVTESPTGARVVSVGVTLDAVGLAQLRREFRALLARSGNPLIVDLTAVRAVDSVRAPVVLRHLACDAGDADVDFRVVWDLVANERARPVLGDESPFDIYPTLDAALEDLYRRDR